MIRKAIVKDANSIARVVVDTWKSTYQGIVPTDYLTQLSYSQVEMNLIETIKQPDKHVIVYEQNDQIIGFSTYGKERTRDYPLFNEVYALYVLKEHQKQGIGKALLHFIFNELKEGQLIIWTLKENSATFFYEKMEGSKYAEKTITIGEKPLIEYGYLFNLNEKK